MKISNLNLKYNSLKENLSIIILIPTIIGGLWQLLELSFISTSFIRFFSISQLVADGILILLIISIIYATFLISAKIIKKENFQFNINKRTSIWSCIISISLGVLTFFYIAFPLLEEIYRRQSIKIFEIVLLIPIMTIIIEITFLGIFRLFENIVYKYRNVFYKFLIKLKNRKKFTENFSYFLSLIIFLTGILLIKFILIDMNPYTSSFHKDIVFPENLLNKEILDKKITKDYNLKFKPILIYNNDKYFFYRIYDSKKNEKILIVDYSKLTDK